MPPARARVEAFRDQFVLAEGGGSGHRRAGRRVRFAALVVALALALTGLASVPAAAAPLFTDGFEDGNIAPWTPSASGFVLEQANPHTGSWNARATDAGGSGAFASRDLAATQPEVFFRTWFKLIGDPATPVFLLRVRTATGLLIASVGVNEGNRLIQRNDTATPPDVTPSDTTVSLNAYHEVQMHVKVGATSLIEVWFDGQPVAALTTNTSLGTTPIGRLQIGDNQSGRTFNVAFDDVVADTAFIGGGGGGGGDPIIAAAGDIVCDPNSGAFNGGNGTATKCHMSKTADILENLLASPAGLDKILPLGDDQYDCGGLSAYTNAYSQSWGQTGQTDLKAISRPIPGDNEYLTRSNTPDGTGCGPNADASGYFDYFGAAAGTAPKGWYSYNLGAWHIIALNSECSLAAVGGCGPTSPQGQFLSADLAASNAACTLAYFHKPRFTSGKGGGTSDVAPFWTALQKRGVEIVLNGHHHVYERFAPQTPGAVASANGIRQFTVGTGGKSLSTFVGPPFHPNSQVRYNGGYGVLKLTLHATSYDWQFISEAGKSFTDSGTTNCH